MKKHPFILTAILAGLVFGACGSVSASPYTISDQTLVIGKHSRPDPSPNDDSTLYSYTGWQDVIGVPGTFGVYGIDATRVGHNINFKLYTNFSGSDYYTTTNDPTTYNYYVADFAIDTNRNGTFNYGVVLKNHADWGHGTAPSASTLTVGLYSVNRWDSPAYFFDEPSDFISGGIDYGQYYKKDGSSDNSARTSIVAMAGGTRLVDTMDVSMTTGSGWANAEYIYSFSINADSIGVFGKPFNVFWGGANCSNDAIAGTVPVPEPASVVLLSFGLLAIAGLGRRKQK